MFYANTDFSEQNFGAKMMTQIMVSSLNKPMTFKVEFSKTFFVKNFSESSFGTPQQPSTGQNDEPPGLKTKKKIIYNFVIVGYDEIIDKNDEKNGNDEEIESPPTAQNTESSNLESRSIVHSFVNWWWNKRKIYSDKWYMFFDSLLNFIIVTIFLAYYSKAFYMCNK